MNTIEATFRIVTPMFIGGADQTPSDGIRPPSVKGALRFWWRALNWGRFFQQENQDKTKALLALHTEEARLFGLAATTVEGKKVGGQGVFLLTVRPAQLTSKQPPVVHDKLLTKAAARYLGYGLIVAYGSQKQNPPTQSGQLIRGCINEDQSFTIILTFRNHANVSILNALKAMGLLGGLGSRTRHGMGSIALEKIVHAEQEIWTAPKTQEEYQIQVKELVGSLVGIPEPDYSAFSKESRVECLLSNNSPYQVLDDFGNKMLDYRSWGQSNNGNMLPSGKASEKRFKDDHDWLREPTFKTTNSTFHPRRVMFGLPHNYGKYDNQKVNAATHERRASPLLFHVHRLSDNEYIGVSVLLKSRFLPVSEQINAGGKNVAAKVNDWAVISDFLDGKVGNPPTVDDRFPVQGKKAVLP